MLGCGWDERSDVWSLGCILMEIYTGDFLFTFLRQEDDQEDDIEHLALMERLLQESLPLELLDSADPKRAAKLVLKQDNGSRLGWPEWARAAESLKHVERQPSSLSSLVLPWLLEPCDSRRLSATLALKHRFFRKEILASGLT